MAVLAELPAFGLPRTSKLTGLYNSGDDGLTKCVRFFQYFKIHFKVGQVYLLGHHKENITVDFL